MPFGTGRAILITNDGLIMEQEFPMPLPSRIYLPAPVSVPVNLAGEPLPDVSALPARRCFEYFRTCSNGKIRTYIERGEQETT